MRHRRRSSGFSSFGDGFNRLGNPVVIAPVITSDGGGATAAVDADGTDVTTVVSYGTRPITFSLSGADAALFVIGSSSGILTLIEEQDPDDYVVIVTAINSAGSDSQTITVTVADDNTAPTEIHMVWAADGDLNGTDTIAAGTYTGHVLVAHISELTTDDAEGGPFTYSLVDDHDGLFTIAVVGLAGLLLRMGNGVDDIVLEPGTINFTLRSTDPGNLFVDQEFTITVAGGVEEAVLSNAFIFASGSTTANIVVDTTGVDGTIYYVVTQESTPPSLGQIIGGNDANDAPGEDAGTMPVSGADSYGTGVTGLAPETDYYVFFEHLVTDSETGSNIIGAGPATTDA